MNTLLLIGFILTEIGFATFELSGRTTRKEWAHDASARKYVAAFKEKPSR